MAEQNVQIAVGNIVVSRSFDISGEGIPETPGFKVRIAFTNQTDLLDAAARSVVIAVQARLRAEYRKNKTFSYRPGVEFTVNSKGASSLTKEEKEQQALNVILNNSELLAKLEAALAARRGTVPLSVQPDSTTKIPDELEVRVGMWLKKTTRQLHEACEENGIETADLSREEMAEELAMIE